MPPGWMPTCASAGCAPDCRAAGLCCYLALSGADVSNSSTITTGILATMLCGRRGGICTQVVTRLEPAEDEDSIILKNGKLVMNFTEQPCRRQNYLPGQ